MIAFGFFVDAFTWDQPFFYPPFSTLCPLFTFSNPFLVRVSLHSLLHHICHVKSLHPIPAEDSPSTTLFEKWRQFCRTRAPWPTGVVAFLLAGCIHRSQRHNLKRYRHKFQWDIEHLFPRTHVFFWAVKCYAHNQDQRTKHDGQLQLYNQLHLCFPLFVVGRNAMCVRGWERPCVCLCESILGSPRIISLPLSVLAILSLHIRFVVPHAPTIAGLIEWSADLFIRQFDSQS